MEPEGPGGDRAVILFLALLALALAVWIVVGG